MMSGGLRTTHGFIRNPQTSPTTVTFLGPLVVTYLPALAFARFRRASL